MVRNFLLDRFLAYSSRVPEIWHKNDIIKFIFAGSDAGEPRAHDYCKHETFEAHCIQDEVILMSSAVNGRMRYGRCIEKDYGYVGCQTDVLHLADQRCSGRRSCRIPIPDKTFDEVTPCPKDLTSYLSASYTCVKGWGLLQDYIVVVAHAFELIFLRNFYDIYQKYMYVYRGADPFYKCGGDTLD